MYQTQDFKQKEKALLVGVKLPTIDDFTHQDCLAELKLLAETAGAEVVDTVVQDRKKLNPAFFIGKGKIDQIKKICEGEKIDIIIFDDDLSPAQIYNIEDRTDVKVIDRSSLILDIFAKRARTKEAKTQVALAQLKYLLPRLAGRWEHLSRQYGGIGTKGPGETQLEVDRRQTRKRIADLEKVLVKIDNERKIQRKNRADLFKICLVGYTNVGKSTLFNRLTEASVFVEKKLFSTLDSTTRILKFSKSSRCSANVVLTDTIGFIRKLPHHLIASFRSTLDEVRLADLLLHLVDISHPDFRNQIKRANEVLAELGSKETPTIMVFNKIDKLDGDFPYVQNVTCGSDFVFICAEQGVGIEKLTDLLDRHLSEDIVEGVVVLENSKLGFLSFLYRFGTITEKKIGERKTQVKIRGKRWSLKRLQNFDGKIKFHFL